MSALLIRLARLSFVCAVLAFPTTIFAQAGTAEFRAEDRGGPQEGQNSQVNPQLWQELVNWEKFSAKVNSLSGSHRRFVYDRVFEVEKRADGKFYYEAPDKGRIDITEVELAEDEQSLRKNKLGKPYRLESDIPEIWICDGQQIAQGIVPQKIYSVFNIPAEQQGRNIMDGPLPFLFGLPANIAIQRYSITLLDQTAENYVSLRILPRRQQDLQSWREAEVILNRKNYLPIAVKMVDPTGNRETVYRFDELEPNRPNNPIFEIFGRTPFNIKLAMKGFKEIKQNVAQQEGQPGAGPRPNMAPQPDNPPSSPAEKQLFMPDVSKMEWKAIQKMFADRGFQVEFRKAGPAPSPEQVFNVAVQEPKPGVPLKAGQKVTVHLFDELKTAGK